jgi:hypothetical protein
MILFAMGLMIMGASMSAQAQLPGPVEKTKMQGPDLITDGIREMDLNNGKLEVAVKNIGENASKKSVVRLKITPTDGLKDSLTANVKVLAPGEIVWIPMSFGKPLNLANYCAVADALKQNAETNEKNNEKCGQLSGKP